LTGNAIVTGASSGIGREAAKQLAQEGWKVLAVARRENRLKALEQENSNIVAHVADITVAGAPEAVMAAAAEKLGGLDLLVNNAGTSWITTVADMPVEKLDQIYNLNVRALILMCQKAIPLLEKSEKAQIINVASVAGHLPMATLAAYCSSKAAAIMFSRVLAKELTERKIRVNVLNPCGTDTEIFDVAGGNAPTEEARKGMVSAADMGRMVVELTQLPAGLDIGEVAVHRRLNPY